MQGVLSCGYEEVLAIPVHKPAKPAEPEIILTGMWGFLSRKLGIDPWGQILIVLLIILFGGVIEGFRLANSKIDDLQIPTTIDNKLRPVATEVHGLSERMSTIEGELKILLTQKSLAAAGKYAREGKTELAVKAAQQAAESVTSAAAGKLPATPQYFVDTIEMINGVAKVSPSADLSRKLQDIRLYLAQYRSALLVGTVTYTQKITAERIEHAFALKGKAEIDGGYFDASKMTGEFAVVATGHTPSLSDNNTFRGTLITGGIQTLDGIHWINVTFVGTKIRYAGGQLDLDHVTFIGCTFAAPDNDRGEKFAEYAALLLPTLLIT